MLNPIPNKIPEKILQDISLAGFFRDLLRSIFQMFSLLSGNKNIVLINTIESLDVTTLGYTEIFKIPQSKTFIPIYAIIRVTNFVAGPKTTQVVASIGSNSPNYNNFLNSITYPVSSPNGFLISQPPMNTELTTQGLESSFGINIETASNATTETWAIDIFGYFV